MAAEPVSRLIAKSASGVAVGVTAILSVAAVGVSLLVRGRPAGQPTV